MNLKIGFKNSEDNIDSEEYLERVRTDARYDSGNERPPSNAEELSMTEQGILNDGLRILRFEKNQAEQRIAEKRDKTITRIEDIDVEHVTNRLNASILDLKQTEQPHLEELIRERDQRQASLDQFKSEHRISRMADYPENRLWSVAMLVIMIIVESVLNANMLAKTSLYGLIGGWAEAIFISLANIFAGFFTGFIPFRYIGFNKIRKPQTSKIAKTAFISCSAFILIFNFIFAHYRLVGTPETTNIVGATLNHIVSNPLAIFLDIKSFALFVVGLVFSGLAGWKGYDWDDPYPGYGKVYKKWDNSKQALLKAEDMVRKKCKSIVEEKIKRLGKDRKIVKAELQRPDSFIEDCEMEKKHFERFASCLEARMLHLVSAYRDTNRELRKTQAPAYFNTPPAIPTEDLQLQCEVPHFRNEIEKRETIATRMLEGIDSTLKQLVELESQIMSEMTEFFSKLDTEIREEEWKEQQPQNENSTDGYTGKSEEEES